MTGITMLPGGGITAPRGFRAGGAYAGVKTYGDGPRLDVGLWCPDRPAVVSAMFTRNAVVGESLRWTREIVAAERSVAAVVVNSGNANCVTGRQGAADAAALARSAAAHLGVAPEAVLVGSTGVIGRPLPMDRLGAGIAACTPTADAAGGTAFARAILTTDTRPKEAAARVETAAGIYTVGGCAKGSGMIHPDMATMFGFLATDAPVERAWLDRTLRGAVDGSFHLVDVDMDTSTCDMVVALASGAAGGEPVDDGHPAAGPLAAAITQVARALAREVARDGEGATCLLTATVTGAPDDGAARRVARTIVSSPLVKTMVTGRDPNWGRVLMAAGRAGVPFELAAVDVSLAGHAVVAAGEPLAVDLGAVSRAMGAPEVTIEVHLGGGPGQAEAWGCNMTADYVRINADYTT